MAVKTTDLIKLIELLPEQAKQSAYDYLLFLSNRYQPAAEPLAVERIGQIKKDYEKEIQELETEHGSLDALMRKENKTDKDRNDLDNWLFYLEQLKSLGQ
ncbi:MULTISPECIES: hypothetical protein [Brevibacillus]|uniref:hypothetical protein n=1 Tax=Brevibacillus TaxID=55080 RepID=UPI00203D62BD|nr:MULTISPECIES: hypothetical protein [Brevibacillus]MCM3625261.1 hypothetical protein [Brevibacillus borstelensis]MDH4620041.1 hypothetical protein [Brevibacillus sp. AY1]